MGRPTAECVDQMLLNKIKRLVSHALERAAKDLPQGKRSFRDFVSDLDVHDSFSKRIFELLIKETIARRPRAVKSQARRISPLPAWRQIRNPSPDEGSLIGRRYERGPLPMISDLSGTPAFNSAPPVSDSRVQVRRIDLGLGLPESNHSGYYAYAPDGRFGPPPPTFDAEGNVEALRDYPDFFAASNGETRPEAARPHNRVMDLSASSETSGNSPLPQASHREERPAGSSHDELISVTGPGGMTANRIYRVITPPPPLRQRSARARDDFEAFSSRRRSRLRQAEHDALEGSDGEDVYERLGSSSSVAALAGLEYSHASWDAEAVRQRSDDGLTMHEFLTQEDHNQYHQTTSSIVRRLADHDSLQESETRRFEQSDARAPL